jgi:hypothetical protein
MSQAEFAAAVLGWHDFFLASAGASAALLGLLFVGTKGTAREISGHAHRTEASNGAISPRLDNLEHANAAPGWPLPLLHRDG